MITSRRSFLRALAASAGSLPFLGTAKSLASLTQGVPRRKFGRHEEMVSVVGLGGQTLGMASSKGEAVKIARRAIDLGIDFFDNAWDYLGGRAEEWMGEALEGGWREKVFLMTKVCTHLVGMDKMEFVEAAAQASAGPPMSREEREAFTVSVARQGGPGFAVYLREGYRDGDSAIDPGHPA